MTTQPTPEEQLAKWRVKFESRYDLSELDTVYERYVNQTVREAWGNYVEAREDALQETEQAMKEFKLQLTLLLDSSDYYAVENIDQYHIEAAAMKGLLK